MNTTLADRVDSWVAELSELSVERVQIETMGVMKLRIRLVRADGAEFEGILDARLADEAGKKLRLAAIQSAPMAPSYEA